MMNLGKIIGIRAMRSKSVGFPGLETRSIYKSQILKNIKTYMIMKANLIFFLAIFIISALFIGHFRLTFSPFSVSFPYWHRAVGVILIVAGCLVYNIGEHISGYKKGLDEGMEIVLKELKERYNEEDNVQR